MDTLEKELQELKEKYAKKEAELLREHKIRNILGNTFDGYEKPFIHFSKLYGTSGLIAVNYNRFQYGQNKPRNPDTALLRALIQKFPAVPILKYKDGCLSFRPEQQAEQDAAKAIENGITVDLYECGPVTVRIDPAHFSQSASFEWVAEIDGGLWRIQVEFSMYAVELGTLDLKFATYPDGEVKRVERCQFNPAWDAQVIRWGRGDEKTPNSFTLYWDRDTAATLDYSAMVKAGRS